MSVNVSSIKKNNILLNYMIRHCLTCTEDKECSECEVQEVIDKMMQEE